MKAQQIYYHIKSIISDIHSHEDQMFAIAKWIEAEFEHSQTKINISNYNAAFELQVYREKGTKGVLALSKCQHCGRKYEICCICGPAEKRWSEMIKEVKSVAENNNNKPE